MNQVSVTVVAAMFVAAAAVEGWGVELDRWSTGDVRDLNALLRRTDVRVELGMTRDQVEMMRNVSSVTDELEAQFRIEAPSLTRAELAQFQQKIGVKRLTASRDYLTDEQWKRLEQLKIQYHVLRDGLPVVLNQTIELTEEQQGLLRDKEDALGDELRALMWSFYQRSQQAFTQFLTSSQRAQWRQMIQREFRFD